jgi:hypothetical protein
VRMIGQYVVRTCLIVALILFVFHERIFSGTTKIIRSSAQHIGGCNLDSILLLILKAMQSEGFGIQYSTDKIKAIDLYYKKEGQKLKYKLRNTY